MIKTIALLLAGPVVVGAYCAGLYRAMLWFSGSEMLSIGFAVVLGVFGMIGVLGAVARTDYQS